ncbi:MAG: CopL family metal-binding regulatory protein [Xanthomonadaceae bacterium]|jgi:hypothetical protein|nr:CopL family metal-binding regulatory protein [Xanthomonadaceae bacterium]
MSPAAFLLRLLLCISLILNGPAYAAQAAAMPMPMGSHTGISSDAAPPCHSQADAVAVQAGSDHSRIADRSTGKSPNPDEGDCCQAGDCVRACHSQAPLAMVADAFVPGVRGIRVFAGAKDTRIEIATSAPLIRPPIA